jgi:benzoate-CoA ligase
VEQQSQRSIVDYLAQQAARCGHHPAILYEDQALSFQELEQRSAQCRGALRHLGIEPGDRVAMVMADGPDWVTAFLGCLGLGAMAVPCSTMMKPAELGYVLKDCGARAAIITPDQVETLQAARAEAPSLETVLLAGGEHAEMLSFNRLLEAAAPAPLAEIESDTLAFILYTSGSTGAPKGAVHRHGDIPCTIERVGRGLFEVTPDDRLFSSSRLFFAYGLGNSLSFPLGAGATSILCRERPTPPVIAEVFTRHRPTIFFGVPAVFRALLEYYRQGHWLDTGSLNFCVSAGEKLPEQIFHEWKEATGLEIVDAIGSTELLHMFIANYRGRLRPGSSGVPIDGYEVKLLDERGQEIVGEGHGDLYVKGASAIPFYWNKPEKTAETIRDGWVKTGDVYRRDAEGFYWFEGRSDDLFKSSGMWVSPGEVEEALCAHPAVLEAAVIAEPDESGANLVAAYAVLRPGASPDDALREAIKAQAASSLPRYKCPKRIHFIEQLPRTATGKVQRFKLRASSAASPGN